MSEGKPKYTKSQKRLLALVYIMGAILLVLFVFVLGTIAWKLAHIH